MNFLVTGGCGFIGTNLARALYAAGHHVRILDREPKNKSIYGVVQVDIRDKLVYNILLLRLVYSLLLIILVRIWKSMWVVLSIFWKLLSYKVLNDLSLPRLVRYLVIRILHLMRI